MAPSNTQSYAADVTRGYLLAAQVTQAGVDAAHARYHRAIVAAFDHGASVDDLASALGRTDLYIANVLRSHDRHGQDTTS